MKDITFGIIIGMSLLGIGITMLSIPAIAEINKTDSAVEGIDFKIFVFGNDPSIILKGTQADFEITGYPTTQILIRNWDKLTPLEQSTITTQLNSEGYFESR
jgi:hypothetical protein